MTILKHNIGTSTNGDDITAYGLTSIKDIPNDVQLKDLSKYHSSLIISYMRNTERYTMSLILAYIRRMIKKLEAND
jgi:hypothetical protein